MKMTSKEIINNVIFNLKKHCVDNFVDLTEDIDNFEIVLKDLERKEELEKENQELKEEENRLCIEAGKSFYENAKLKKAIQILKERGGIELFINRNNDNKLTLDFDDCISCVLEPKEYELLKEVLGNE